jgi:ribosomal protein L16 Arg81 hydroxylase
MLDRLLVRASAADFLRRHYHFLPYSEPDGCRALAPLGAEDLFDRLRASPSAEVAIGREGGKADAAFDGSPAVARSLLDSGHTIVVRHAERHDGALAELARDFRRALGGDVDVHAVETPAGRPGFGWHCDFEEVFLLQLAGTKAYRLRKNTVHPWPVRETIRRQTTIDREGSSLGLEVELREGDWLYVPSGWWHEGEARTRSRSLAIGVAAPSGLDVLSAARETLLDSLLWRRRLPVSPLDGRPEAERVARFRALLDELLADLRETIGSPDWIRAFLRSATADGGRDARR